VQVAAAQERMCKRQSVAHDADAARRLEAWQILDAWMCNGVCSVVTMVLSGRWSVYR